MAESQESPDKAAGPNPDNEGPHQPPSDEAAKKAANRLELYRFGFFVILALSIVSIVTLVRLWRLANSMANDYQQLAADTEKAVKLLEDCHAQSKKDIENLKDCSLKLEKTVHLAESCVDDTRKASLLAESCVADLHSTNSLLGGEVACRKELNYIAKQDQLEINKLSGNLDACYDEVAALQKKLLKPCPGF